MVGTHTRSKGLAVPTQLCPCPSPTYQQCTQDGCRLGTVGQPQLPHSGPCLLQEAHHSCGLYLGIQYRGVCHLTRAEAFAGPLGGAGLTMEWCRSRLWSWWQALANMTRVSAVTLWQSESLRKVSRGQNLLTSCGKREVMWGWGGRS